MEEILHSNGDWLDGFLEVHPWITVGVVGVVVLAALIYLWRRLR